MKDLNELGLKDITLNFDTGELDDIQLVQGDTKTRGFNVELVSNSGEVIQPNSDITLKLFGTNLNDPTKTYYTVAKVIDDKYQVFFSTDMLGKMGKVEFQLALYQGTDKLIQSNTYISEVEKSLCNGGSTGKDLVVDFTKLEKALERVDTQEKAYQDSLKKQETIKADIDKKQKQVSTDTTTVEKIRTDMENIMSSEADRVEAEKDRQDFELQRAKAETERVSAENARVDAEKDRQDQENTRESNEDERKSAESARVSAENTRKSQESTRQSQETQRVEAEKKRKTTFEGWNLTMQGVIPNATEDTSGVVRVSSVEGETAPYTVPSAGALSEGLNEIYEEVFKKADKVHSHSISDTKDLDGWLKQLANSTTENMANLAQKADKIHVHRDKDIILDSTGDTLEKYVETLDMSLGVAIDSKISFRGQNPAKNIQIIEKGTSISDIPKETLIFELE